MNSRGMSQKVNILFTSQDPGGWNAVAPVIRAVDENEKAVVHVFLSKHSCELAEEAGVSYVDAGTLSEDELFARLEDIGIDVVVAGNSGDVMSVNKKIIAWAHERGVPSVAVSDYWSGYTERFSTPGTDDLAFLPTVITVIDQLMFDDMVAEGFDPSLLRITGNPHFDTFSCLSGGNESYLLYASQPFSERESTDEVLSRFDEVEIFSDYVAALEEVGITDLVLVKLHPRCENTGKYDDIIRSSHLNISIIDGTIEELLAGAKLVFGATTMVLFHAALSGKRVLSYEPRVTASEDPLASNRLGLSRVVYEKGELVEAVRELLQDDEVSHSLSNLRREYVEAGATRKVILLIDELVKGVVLG